MTEEKDNSNHLDTEKIALKDNKIEKEEEKKEEKKVDTTKDIKNEETGKTQNIVVIQSKKAYKQQNKEEKEKENEKESGVSKGTLAGVAGAGLLTVTAIASSDGCCAKFKEKFCCCFK